VNEFREHLKAAVLTPDSQSYWHIGEEQMIAFYEGELTANQREAMQNHLAVCAECLSLFRSVSDFFDPARENEEPMTEAEVATEWHELWAKIKKENPGNVIPFLPKIVKKPYSVMRLAVAASLLLSFGSTVYLAWQVQQEKREAEAARNDVAKTRQELERQTARTEQTIRDLSQKNEALLAEQTLLAQRIQPPTEVSPIPNNIEPENFSFGEVRAGEGKSLEFAASVQAKLLIIEISNPNSFPNYIVEMQDESGKLAQAPARLRPLGDENTLNMVISRAGLKEEKYRLVLYGVRGQEKKRLGEQTVTIKLNR